MNTKIRGVLSVELAICLVFLSGLFVVMINHLVAFNNKGVLDRAAYSAVTVLSERKELFDGELNICVDADQCDFEIEKVFRFISGSLKRMNESFDSSKLGLRVDYVSVLNDENTSELSLNNVKKLYGNTSKCKFPGVSDIDPELLPRVSIDVIELLGGNVYLPLYQVSLCYEIPLDLLGAPTGEIFRLMSTSYSFVRI